jgi:heme iron utilization protein
MPAVNLKGREGRGYFNIHGETPIGGHLRMQRCRSIYFFDRCSCSLQFVNQDAA